MSKNAQEVFRRYKMQEYEPFFQGVWGTYLFDIEEVGSWFVSVNDGAVDTWPSTDVDKTKREADCVIRSNEEDFIGIIEGRRNLLAAALQGRVQVSGDWALAQKFHGLVAAAIEQRTRGEA